MPLPPPDRSSSSILRWEDELLPDTALNAAFVADDTDGDARLAQILLAISLGGFISVQLADDSHTGPQVSPHFSDLFAVAGTIHIAVTDELSFTITHIGVVDPSEPYLFFVTGQVAEDLRAFVQAVHALPASDLNAITATLSDGTPDPPVPSPNPLSPGTPIPPAPGEIEIGYAVRGFTALDDALADQVTQFDRLTVGVDRLAEIVNPTTCPPEWLPFLAAKREAITWTNLLGADFQRQAIRDARLYNVYRQTRYVIDRFAASLPFQYVGSISTNNEGRITAITISVLGDTAPGGVDLRAYIARTIKELLPAVRGRVVTVTFRDVFSGTLYLAAALRLTYRLRFETL